MKILLAVDGSKHSQWAERLLSLVTGPGHSVEVLTVIPVVHRGDAGIPSITEVIRESGAKMVRAVAKGLGKKFKTSTAVVESSDVAATILDRAKKFRADLVVLGARGVTPLKTFFLGSVSNKVTRHATCSVLVAHRNPGRTLTVLSAVDGSPEGRRATAFAHKLGAARSARLILVHVLAEPMVFWIPEVGVPGGYGNVSAHQVSLKALRERGARVLADAKKEWVGQFKSVRTQLREGHPSGEILHAAKSSRASLVVVGRRGLSRLDRFFMGSVSQKVSSYASCGVLIVH
ncbi:MAG: universal stress protein [Elusimicrobia bacterium]|jgi:nucleotide-binding universal stress UspA family protein|nr:universal stress protein [Elusimicrobiota bacterium]